MRRLRGSSGLRHSCAEGAESYCCVQRVIPTKSIVRIELEQQTYAEGNIAHRPATDCPKRISGLQALLEGAPRLLDSKALWHRALEGLLDGTRDGSEHPYCGRLRSETKLNNRTASPNRRAGKVERSNASRWNVDRQRRK